MRRAVKTERVPNSKAVAMGADASISIVPSMSTSGLSFDIRGSKQIAAIHIARVDSAR
jgi:hypothetical protein